MSAASERIRILDLADRAVHRAQTDGSLTLAKLRERIRFIEYLKMEVLARFNRGASIDGDAWRALLQLADETT